MAALAVEYIIGYQGTPLYYVDNSRALSICGNALCYYSLSGVKNTHILWGEGLGISASAYHQKMQYVAYAEKGLKPSVYIHDCRDSRVRLISKLSDVAELEIPALAFSDNAQRFATASCEPDFRLILWTLQSKAEKLIEGHLGECVTEDIRFNPANENQLCVLGHGDIYLWTFQSSYHKMSFTCKRFSTGAHFPLCYTWTTGGNVVYTGGKKGEILVFNVGLHDLSAGESEVAELLQHAAGKVPNAENITNICARETHLLVAADGGHLLWVQSPTQGTKEKGENSVESLEMDFYDLRILSEVKLIIPDIISIAYRHDGAQVLVGSSNGTMLTVCVSASTLDHLMQTSTPLVAIKGEDQDQKIKPHTAGTPQQDQKGRPPIQGVSQQDQKGKPQTLLPDQKAKPQSPVPSQIAQVEWQSTHHTGAVLAIGTLRDGKHLVTCGDDGTVRVWDAGKGKELSRQQYKSVQNCITTHEASYLVAAGAENGDVNVIKVDSGGKSAAIFRSKVHQCPLDVVLFSTTAPMLVAASRTDERVFFLHSETPDWTQLQLLGFALMKDPVLSIAWDIQSKGEEDLYLMVSLLRGEIVRVKVPMMRAPGGGLVFDTKVIRRISIRTAVPLQSIVVGKYYLEKEGVERRVVWGLGADKKLLLYRLPDSLQGWTGSDAMPHTAQHNLLAHSKPGYAIVLLPEASILVTGAEDGVLQIRNSVLDPVKPPQKVLEVRMFDGFCGGMTCATVAGGRLFAASATGLIFSCDAADAGIVKVRGASRPKDDFSIGEPKKPLISEGGDAEELSMVEAHEKKLQERSLMAAEAYKNEMRKRIANIQKEFNEVLEKNKEAPELEKLTPVELIVDIDLEALLRKDGVEKVEIASEKVRIEDLKKDVLVDHIKTECWSTLSEPGVFIWPFSKGHEVQSFPLLVKNGYDSRLAQVTLALKEENEKAMTQRLSTARSSTARSTAENTADGATSSRSKATEDSKSVVGSLPDISPVPPDVPPRPNLSPSRRGSVAVPLIQAEAAAQAAAQQLATPSESTVTATPGAAEMDDDEEETLNLPEKGPVENFLYTGYELTSSKRKRLQRLLLHAQLQEIRVGFNKKLAEMQEDKKQRIVKIKEALQRINDLERALQISDKYVPAGSMVEPPGMEKVFVVKNDEITVKKYLNKVERAAAEEQRKLEEEQERIRAGNNWTERALVDMMGGKLEHKVEVIVVEAEIPRPAWMSGNLKKMTKEQIKEIKEFDARVKAIKEEKERKIRGQETEMRKLKADIEELSDGFDKAVADLFGFRLKEEARISSIEESVSRLSLEIEHEEFLDEKKEADLVKSLDQLKLSKAASVGAVSEFKHELDAFKEQYQLAVEEDRELDRNFKKEFEDLGEFLSQLYRLFRKRQATTAKGEKGKPQAGKDSNLTKTGQNDSSRTGLATPSAGPVYQLDPINDMPEDMEMEQWHRFLRYRNKKIDQEEEVRAMHAHLTEMSGYLDELISIDDVNRKQIAATLRTLTEFRESREKKRRNLELIFHVKSGFVEMELKPLEGDYTDAALMARTIIEEFDELVLQRANVKIEILIQIKNFKRGIFEVQWEIKRLKMLTRNLIEKVRHLQLLRSTKVLQNVIKTGEDLSLASEGAALQNRLEHNESLQAKKMLEKKAYLRQLMKQAKLVTAQNAELQSQAAMVFQEFKFQEGLCSSSVAKESKDSALKQRVEGLFTQRRLRELARAQIDYLAALNKEYQRVKAFTRPDLPLAHGKGKKSSSRLGTKNAQHK